MSSSSIVPATELPLELVEDVLGHLRHDKAALLLCAVVNRKFLVASRLHLFSSIALKVQRNPAALHEFRCWLEATPHMASYVRSLDIGEATQTLEAKPVEIALSDLLALLQKLHGLQTIRLYGVTWAKAASKRPRHPQDLGPASTPIEPVCFNARRLECHFPFLPTQADPACIFDLVRHMTSLKEIRLTGGRFRSSSRQHLPFCRIAYLRELHLDFVHSVPLLPLLSQPSLTCPLESLSVATGPLNDVVQLIAFASTQPRLVDLAIRLGFHDCFGKHDEHAHPVVY